MTAPLRDWQVVLSKYVACLGFYVVLWLPTLVYLPALQGARPALVEPAITVWSVLLVLGLVVLLVGAVLLLPRLGTTGRLVSVGLVVGGTLLAVVAGLLHYRNDDKHLLEVPVLIDPNPALVTYLGMFLAGAMFLAIGLLVSSLVRNQLVAAVISFGLGLVFIMFGLGSSVIKVGPVAVGVAGFRPEEGTALYQVAYFFTVPLHFERSFTRGIIDTRPLVLYVSLTVFCLFVTVRSLEARRWL
jgi:ABC-type transport system involved in multi-copper enzyme maturation permease subunit